MRRPVRSALLAGVLSLYGGCAIAIIPEWPQAGWVWAQEQTADLSGVRLFQRELSAPLEPAEVARTLAARLPQLDRLVILKGQILLSGLDPTHHWLAQVDSDVMGARAVISAMTVEPTRAQHEDFDSAPYMPGDARRLFNHVQILDGQRIVQVLYESVRNRFALLAQMRRTLLQAGWHDEGVMTGDEAQYWQRVGERLHLRVYERGRGSVLWMQHQGGGQP